MPLCKSVLFLGMSWALVTGRRQKLMYELQQSECWVLPGYLHIGWARAQVGISHLLRSEWGSSENLCLAEGAQEPRGWMIAWWSAVGGQGDRRRRKEARRRDGGFHMLEGPWKSMQLIQQMLGRHHPPGGFSWQRGPPLPFFRMPWGPLFSEVSLAIYFHWISPGMGRRTHTVWRVLSPPGALCLAHVE